MNHKDGGKEITFTMDLYDHMVPHMQNLPKIPSTKLVRDYIPKPTKDSDRRVKRKKKEQDYDEEDEEECKSKTLAMYWRSLCKVFDQRHYTTPTSSTFLHFTNIPKTALRLPAKAIKKKQKILIITPRRLNTRRQKLHHQTTR
jgi:hypothetical protein